MITAMLLAIPMVMATPHGANAPFADPLDDARLAAVTGTGLPTTRLSVLVGEQGTAQGQWAGEDQRAALAVWFADDNVQLFANAVLRGG